MPILLLATKRESTLTYNENFKIPIRPLASPGLHLLPASNCLLPLPSPPDEASLPPQPRKTLGGALPRSSPRSPVPDGGDVGSCSERRRQRQRLSCGGGGACGAAHQPHGHCAAHRSVP